MKNLLTIFLLGVLVMSIGEAAAAESREWAFRVSLDDKEVGSHYFRIDEKDGKTRLETEADLAVKMLLITVYRYLHRNVESWEDGCLTGIESSTKVNGKTQAVSGQRQGDFFNVRSSGESVRLPECVMSFAYWNPEILKEARLLNSQNGEYVEVDVSGPVYDERLVRDQTLPAQRYRLNAGDIDLKLWYSLDDQWLALESKMRGGRVLSYELM